MVSRFVKEIDLTSAEKVKEVFVYDDRGHRIKMKITSHTLTAQGKISVRPKQGQSFFINPRLKVGKPLTAHHPHGKKETLIYSINKIEIFED